MGRTKRERRMARGSERATRKGPEPESRKNLTAFKSFRTVEKECQRSSATAARITYPLNPMLFRKVASYCLTFLVISLLSGFMLDHRSALASGNGASRSTSQRAAEDRSAAEKVSAEAEQLLKEQRAESSRKAIEKYQDALQLWRAAGDHRQEASTLKRIGDVYKPLGEYQSALAAYNQALELNRATRDRKSVGETLNEIAYVLLNLGDYKKALGLTHDAVRLSEADRKSVV